MICSEIANHAHICKCTFTELEVLYVLYIQKTYLTYVDTDSRLFEILCRNHIA